ncbi:hypothetical protein GIB67_029304 [Kingdonia uniflora]|uniref:DNA-directed RNA polymerase n=1 Tax=Kingdonia uniflora TaxID=39325 RepID=A0A7J7N8I0_9MAGN|nr:hypothetical protein GIB67_029304 [Kingdonia uniflora]
MELKENRINVREKLRKKEVELVNVQAELACTESEVERLSNTVKREEDNVKYKQSYCDKLVERVEKLKAEISSTRGSKIEMMERLKKKHRVVDYFREQLRKKNLKVKSQIEQIATVEADLKYVQVAQRCEFGRIGRRNMNWRLNLDIPQNNTFWLPRDVLAVADHLIGMKFGMGTLDDMNHLKNKRIRYVADLLQDQLGLALVRLEKSVRGTISGAIRHKLIPTPHNLVTSTPLTTTYESFFGLHPLSQVLDRTNPLTQIVHG